MFPLTSKSQVCEDALKVGQHKRLPALPESENRKSLSGEDAGGRVGGEEKEEKDEMKRRRRRKRRHKNKTERRERDT